MAEEGLRRPPHLQEHRRLRPESSSGSLRCDQNHVWALDFQFDETADWPRLKILNVVTEFTREALAMEVARTCTSDEVVAVIERLVAERGAPVHLRMDNGPELVAWALRDWCRLSRHRRNLYIEPGSPWQKVLSGCLDGRARDELLNVEEFGSLIEAKVIVEAWRIEYNTYRPHSSPRWAHPRGVQEEMGSPTTDPHAHSGWTDKRGPVSDRTSAPLDDPRLF